MQTQEHGSHGSLWEAAVVAAAGIVATVGIMALAGWHLGMLSLIQVPSGLAPIQYDSAWCFLLLAISLLSQVLGREKTGLWTAILVAGFASLVALEHALGMSLPIHWAPPVPVLEGGWAHHDRFGINTTACFLLASAGMVIVHRRYLFLKAQVSVALLGALVSILGIVALFGYLFGIEKAYTWGISTPMSVLSGTAFLFLGLPLMGLAWRSSAEHAPRRTPFVLPVPIASAVLVATVVLWQALLSYERAHRARIHESDLLALRRDIEREARQRMLDVDQTVLRLASTHLLERGRFESESRLLCDRFPGCQATALLGQGMAMRWKRDASAGPPAGEGTFRLLDSLAKAALAEGGLRFAAIPGVAPGGSGHAIAKPVNAGAGSRPNRTRVFIVLFDERRLLAGLLPPQSAGYAIEVRDAGRSLFRSQGFEAPEGGVRRLSVHVALPGIGWTISQVPTRRLRELEKPVLPGIALFGGTLLAVILALAVYLAQRAYVQTVLLRDINLRLRSENEVRKRAERELSRSNAELQQFAYVVSHDLQEPLRNITSYVQLLDRRYRDRLDQDAVDFLGFIVEGSHRMQRLIQDLLAFSRVGSQGVHREPVGPDRYLGEAVENLHQTIETTSAQVSWESLPRVVGDPSQLVQLFQNLVGNAIKFRRPDIPPSVVISAARKGDEWEFSVRDNGIGIAPEYRDRVFQIFQRLHTREEYPGSGIGLSICKKIIEQHGGHIWIENAPEGGAAFLFTLPAAGDAG